MPAGAPEFGARAGLNGAHGPRPDFLDLRPPVRDFEPAQAPSNIEAEQALLGALLYDNAAHERVGDKLSGKHFFEPFHGRLFGATIDTAIKRGQLAEPILLAEQFSRDPAFEDLGGMRYLADLVDRAPPIANVADYSRVIYDLALRRELIRIGGEVSVEAGQGDNPLNAMEQIERAEQQLYGLAETGSASSGFMPFHEALTGAVGMAAEAYNREGGWLASPPALSIWISEARRPASLRPDHHRRPPLDG